MNTLSIILLLLALFNPAGTPSPAPLDAGTVQAIFSDRDNEEGQPFRVTEIVLAEGSFTGPGRVEAVVSFYDANQSHAYGADEIWLLRLTGNAWEPIVKITEADTADFTTTDINGDGVLELLTHTSAGNQGYFVIHRRLIYFVQSGPTDLLTFEGFDNTGWPEKGICAFDARFDFKDVNKDKILEVELTDYYDYCRKEGDTSVFERRSERKTLFRPVLSPSGSIIGIERLR